MKNDMTFYEIGQANSYYNKLRINKGIYLIIVFVFIGVNIILHLFFNEVLFGVLISLAWLLFINFSFCFINFKILKVKKVYNFYMKMDYGNKRQQGLKFVKKGENKIIDGLEFKELIFIDKNDSLISLFLYAFINEKFIINTNYNLSLVNDLIYGVVSNE